MTMRDEYLTKAAEFQARAAGESNRTTRLRELGERLPASS
jgi:hypothetical protein